MKNGPIFDMLMLGHKVGKSDIGGCEVNEGWHLFPCDICCWGLLDMERWLCNLIARFRVTCLLIVLPKNFHGSPFLYCSLAFIF